MAEPARQGGVPHEAPLLDPAAIDQAYRQERARRLARQRRLRDSRRASVRFWSVLLLVLVLAVVLGVSAWREIQSLFGL